MTRILSAGSLRAYARLGAKLNWLLPERLYQKLPVLAYRNYFCDYEPTEWPACWDRPRIGGALRLAAEIIKDLSYALALAESAGVTLEQATTTKRLMERTAEAGYRDRYYTAVIRTIAPR